jgi:hypothetical protein
MGLAKHMSEWKWAVLGGLLLFSATTSAAPASLDGEMPAFLRALHRLLPGWNFGGDLDVGVSVPFRVKGKRQASGELRVSFRNGHFSDPEESMLGDGLVGVIRLGGALGQEEDLPIHGEIVLNEGELLLDRFYFDMGPSPLKLQIQGVWDSKGQSLKDIKGVIEWGNRIHATWEGALHGLWDELEGEIAANVVFPSHEALFKLLVVQPLAQIHSEWEEAGMDGRSHCEARVIARQGKISVKGILHLEETGVHLPSQEVHIQGLYGEVPFDLPTRGGTIEPSVRGDTPTQGYVKIAELDVRALRWSDLTMKFRASPNRFELIEPFALPLFGGSLMVQNMQVTRVMPMPPTIAMGLSVEGVDMGSLTRRLTPFPMAGTLEGKFPEILLEGGALTTTGRLQVRVWGGDVSLSNFWGEQMLTKMRRWGCDVAMHDLNMELVTQSLSFGKMGGVLEGEIKDLAFSFGQPESFSLEIRSVPRKGVKQYIDAKAVENLSILSSGMQAPLLPWFKYYPYSQLGISCKLANDIFTLRGTVVEGDTEYLVKRAFLRGINVINRNPGNRIPWKDMVQRIRRIIPAKGEKVRVQMGS